MKTFIVCILAAFLFVACEKDNSPGIIGQWMLESWEADTVFDDGTVLDTVTQVSNVLYIIDNLDTLTIRRIGESYSTSYYMKFYFPNIIEYNICPINFVCLFAEDIRYKVLNSGEHEMVWKREITDIPGKRITQKLYVRRN